MGLTETLLLAILTSGAVTGLLLFVVKEYLKKLIEGHFAQRQSQQAEQAGRRGKYVDQAIGVFPELTELLYRLMVTLRHADKHPDPRYWDPELRDLTAEYTDWLFRHRFYLDNATFDLLHQGKRILQDYVVLYDVATRHTAQQPPAFDEYCQGHQPRAEDFAGLYQQVVDKLQQQVLGVE